MCHGCAQHVTTTFMSNIDSRCWIVIELVRQIEVPKSKFTCLRTILRGNSILVLSCSFKVSKYISECRPR